MASRTISSGSSSAAVASLTRMPFLPRTRRNSLLISLSTFRSARTLILWTSWISSSASPSIISALRTWHSAASSVIRIGSGAAAKSDGYIFIARARHPATIFSETPSNRPSGSFIALTRSSFTISASSVSSWIGPGSSFSSCRKLRLPPGALALALGAGVAGGDQLFQPADRPGRQAPQGRLGELPLEHRLRRTQQPLDLARRRRLDLHLTAPGQQRAAQPVPRHLHPADVPGQPHDQRVLVADRRLPEPVVLPDLPAVVLHLAGGEVVLGKQRRRHLHLTRNEVHRRLRHILPPREPRLLLEKLQHQAETQPRRARLAGQQPEFLLIQRPAPDEVFQLPLAPHSGPFLPDCTEGRKKADL